MSSGNSVIGRFRGGHGVLTEVPPEQAGTLHVVQRRAAMEGIEQQQLTPTLAALATQIHPSAVIPLSIAAGAGQAAGKVVWYHATLRSMEMPWMQRRLEKPKFKARYERWHQVINGHPWTGAGLTFASGLVGIPPLLVMGVLGGALRMNQTVFFGAIFLGRTLQSWAILAGLTSLLGLTSLGH